MRRQLALSVAQALLVAIAMTSAPLAARADGECQAKPGIEDKVKCIEDKIDAFARLVDAKILNQTIATMQTDIKTTQAELGKTLKKDDLVTIINHDGAMNYDVCLSSFGLGGGSPSVGEVRCDRAGDHEAWRLHK